MFVCDNHTKEVPLCVIWFRQKHSFMWMDFAVQFSSLMFTFISSFIICTNLDQGVSNMWLASAFNAVIALIFICCLSWA